MRHRIAGRTLGRTAAHRKALRRNLAMALFQHGAIRTTEPKAKEIKPYVERLISMARTDSVHTRRLVSSELGNRRGVRGEMVRVVDGVETEVEEQSLLDRLFKDIAPRYAGRPGGYTRIIRLAERRIGDAGKQVVLQLVEAGAGGGQGGGSSRRRRRAAKRHEAAGAAVGASAQAPAEGESEEKA